MMAGGFSFGPPAGSTGAGGGGFSFGGGAPSAAAPSFGGLGNTRTGNRDPSTPTTPPSVRALAWDPTSTASLTLFPVPSSNKSSNGKSGASAAKGSDNDDGVDLDVFLSHDGTGCPPEEAECLLRCLDARDEWLGQRRQRGGRRKGSPVGELSMDYRAALCECLIALQNKSQSDDNGGNGGDARMNSNEEEEGNNLELLSLTYAISHLAEIFLLPSAASSVSRFAGGFRDRSSPESRLDGPAGSLTADTVRYLRLHHSKFSSLMELTEVADMLESDQPEYHKFPSTSSNVVPGPFEYPYWNLLLQSVMQGELAKAWTLLWHHSAFRHAEDEAASGKEMSEEAEGFAALHAILLSAPLPGGRADGYCDDAGLNDYLEEELLEQDEEDSKTKTQDVQDGAEDPGDIDQLMIDSVPPNSYLLWEARPRRADRLRSLRYRRDLRLCGRGDDIEGVVGSTAVPEAYQPRVASEAFKNWQETIRVTAFPAGVGSNSGAQGGALDALFRRFPPLQQILSVLLGVVPRSVADDPSTTWSDALLVELLYSRPDITPDDIATRAKVHMSKGGDGQGRALQELVLGIMNGSAGQVVETMFSLCGGSSGAALPATMTSLLCNLLVDAKCISPRNDTSEVNIQTELLILAAESILSSFSAQEQSDVGVRTAVRLLLPHAPPKRAPKSTTDGDPGEGGGIIYEPRIAAMIAEALSRRLPDTDAEARDILQLCEDVVRLGSVVVADACESLAFCRASYHRSRENLTMETHWLLRGMEVMSCWLPADRQRKLGFASRRHFDSLCEQAANALISMLSMTAVTENFSNSNVSEEHGEQMKSVVQGAQAVLDAVEKDDVMASALTGHVQANLLRYAMDIAMAGDDVKMAVNIVHCLEERRLSDEYGCVVSILADPKMYSDLLHIAFAILAKEDDEMKGGPMELAECAFTIDGIHILMCRLTEVMKWEPAKEEYFRSMQLAFCRGLMRCMANNKQSSTAEKKGKGKAEMTLDDEIELMLSPEI